MFCTGGTVTEEGARIAARKIARIVQKAGHPTVKFVDFKIVNVLASFKLSKNAGVKLKDFFKSNNQIATYVFIILFTYVLYLAALYIFCCSYYPEMIERVVVKFTDPKATATVFSTGSVTMIGSLLNHQVFLLNFCLYFCYIDISAQSVESVGLTANRIMGMLVEFQTLPAETLPPTPSRRAPKRSPEKLHYEATPKKVRLVQKNLKPDKQTWEWAGEDEDIGVLLSIPNPIQQSGSVMRVLKGKPPSDG